MTSNHSVNRPNDVDAEIENLRARPIEVARDNGVATLKLDATLNAANFYRSIGFCGYAKGTYRPPRGIFLECMPMIKARGVA